MTAKLKTAPHVLFQVIGSTPIGRVAHEAEVEGQKEAVRMAKFLNRSGYTTIINKVRRNRDGELHIVEAGRPRAPKAR